MELFDRDWWLTRLFWRLHLAFDWLEDRVRLRVVYRAGDWVYVQWARRCYEPETDFPEELAERERLRRKRSG